MATEAESFLDVWKVFNDMRKKGLWLDVKICCNGKNFFAHKSVLAANSAYFKHLFTNVIGDEENTIQIDEVSAQCLEEILTYMYTRTITVTEKNVIELLHAGRGFKINGLNNHCEVFYGSTMNANNVIRLWKFAEKRGLPSLESSAQAYILLKFEDISHSKDFLFLNFQEIYNFMRMDDLNVSSEERVFEAMVKWVNHDVESRSLALPIILKSLRLGLIRSNLFLNEISDHPFIKNNPMCQSIIRNGVKFINDFRRRGAVKTNLDHPLLRPRVPNAVVFAVGGWSGGAPVKCFETYDVKCDRWFQHSHLEESYPRAYHGMIAYKNSLYILGGYDGECYYKSMRKFDIFRKEWLECPSLSHERCYVCAVVHQEYLYCCGGFDGHERLDTVERFDFKENVWIATEPMLNRRSDCGGVSVNNYLYMVGGFNGLECQTSAEYYMAETDQWTRLPFMNEPRSGITLVYLQSCIYAIGGFNGAERLSSVEKYDLGQHEWKRCEAMSTCRSNCAATTLNGQIFAMGGFDGSRTVRRVERYDPVIDSWSDATDMNTPRSALKACVVYGITNIKDYTYYGNSEQEKKRIMHLHTNKVVTLDSS